MYSLTHSFDADKVIFNVNKVLIVYHGPFYTIGLLFTKITDSLV